jgi:hypothetical protein
VRYTEQWPTGLMLRRRERRNGADSVEKVASLMSLQICQNTNDIFD